MIYATPSQEAKRLQVSRSTIQTLLAEGLPHVVIRQSGTRRTIRLDPAAVDKYLAGRRHQQLSDPHRYERARA